ncbi:PHP domain-containing protein [Desulfonatronum sp. SC1]|uniref:PHP domain-containing protein n=1 Tax=Desulfonatronum sp. SC1 TaxID=2109626 RepID=UPI0013049927|nr:PHP domain-containing protein [Desulfonatronum sp. SC1]
MLDAETVDSLNQLFGLPNVTENKFIYLDCQSEYGLNGSLNRVRDLCARAAADGQSSLALTDVGNLYGAIHFFKAAQEYGIKPIIGCRIHVAPESRLHKPRSFKAKPGHQLILLAKDVVGFQNLIALVSLAHMEGYFCRPRVDKELLSRYQEGLIAISPSRNGPVSACLANKGTDAAIDIAGFLKGTFPDSFYLGIEPSEIPDSPEINAATVELATATRLPLVATMSCRYPDEEESLIYDILWCINSGISLNNIHHYSRGRYPFHYRSDDEAALLFQNFPEALTSTVQIAEACNVDLAAFIRSMPDNSGSSDARQHFVLPGQAIGAISFHRWSIPELIEDVGKTLGFEPVEARQAYSWEKARELTAGYGQFLMSDESSRPDDPMDDPPADPELLCYAVNKLAGYASHIAPDTEYYTPVLPHLGGNVPLCRDEDNAPISQWDRESLACLESLNAT